MAYLVLVRHGESTWNARGLWTGIKDIPLTKKGEEEAVFDAGKLKDFKFDIAYTSKLKRAQQTLGIILRKLSVQDLPIVSSESLNERDYGIYTGRNKFEVKSQVGKQQFDIIHRSFGFKPKNGESLKQVYQRVVPYYLQNILLDLKQRKNVLVVAHGNTLRALEKYLDNLDTTQVSKLELAVGEINIYSIDQKGKVVSKLVY